MREATDAHCSCDIANTAGVVSTSVEIVRRREAPQGKGEGGWEGDEGGGEEEPRGKSLQGTVLLPVRSVLLPARSVLLSVRSVLLPVRSLSLSVRSV